jgi:hypothetical protein
VEATAKPVFCGAWVVELDLGRKHALGSAGFREIVELCHQLLSATSCSRPSLSTPESCVALLLPLSNVFSPQLGPRQKRATFPPFLTVFTAAGTRPKRSHLPLFLTVFTMAGTLPGATFPLFSHHSCRVWTIVHFRQSQSVNKQR